MLITEDRIKAHSETPIGARQCLIDGAWCDAEDGQRADITSPIDGATIGSIPLCAPTDVNRAVTAARRSFESGAWSRADPAHRKRVLHRFADLILQNADELAVLGVRDNGTEISMAFFAEPLNASNIVRFYAEALDKLNGDITPTPQNILSLIHREPAGVVGIIIPWNFPLMIGMWKVAPALAAGNSIVVKPSEAASLTNLRVAELAMEAGIPEGVYNVVTGKGSVAGEAIGLSNDVDILAFTGSGGVGRQLLRYSAESNFKQTFLELGGKSPNVVFEDCEDLDVVAKQAAMAVFRNSGQVCVAASRLIVQETIYDDFVGKVADIAAKITVGNPLDLMSQSGAVSSRAQLDTNIRYVDQARKEGDTIITGGNQIHAETGGYYFQPTVIEAASPDSTIVREEVFGPVLAVQKFREEADAVQIANAGDYGLSAGVWTANFGRAHRMVANIKAGVVHVNCYGNADITAPLLGQKQSGNGCDRSVLALEKYQKRKTAWMDFG